MLDTDAAVLAEMLWAAGASVDYRAFTASQLQSAASNAETNGD